MDYLWYNDTYLRKIWYLELAHPFNPSNLPCGVTVVGITLGPEFATNYVGEGHTVNANLTTSSVSPRRESRSSSKSSRDRMRVPAESARSIPTAPPTRTAM